jgi:hypothetical protein
MRIESPVENIQKIEVKLMPKRKLRGVYWVSSNWGSPSLFVTDRGTVYSGTVRSNTLNFIRINTSPTANMMWAKTYFRCGLITREDLDQHLKEVQPVNEKKKKASAAEKVERYAQLAGIKLTKTQQRQIEALL